jgi:hypothetical protein
MLRDLPQMTDEQKQEQAFDFTYGNLACTSNHRPKLAIFAAIAKERGWSDERFAKWSAQKEWW